MKIIKYLCVCIAFIASFCVALEDPDSSCKNTLWYWAEGDAVKYCRDQVKACTKEICNGSCYDVFKYADTSCDTWREKNKCDLKSCIKRKGCKYSVHYSD